MKGKKCLKRLLAIVLVMTILPFQAYAAESVSVDAGSGIEAEEKREEETEVSQNKVSGNTISENIVSENGMPDETVSSDTIAPKKRATNGISEERTGGTHTVHIEISEENKGKVRFYYLDSNYNEVEVNDGDQIEADYLHAQLTHEMGNGESLYGYYKGDSGYYDEIILNGGQISLTQGDCTIEVTEKRYYVVQISNFGEAMLYQYTLDGVSFETLGNNGGLVPADASAKLRISKTTEEGIYKVSVSGVEKEGYLYHKGDIFESSFTNAQIENFGYRVYVRATWINSDEKRTVTINNNASQLTDIYYLEGNKKVPVQSGDEVIIGQTIYIKSTSLAEDKALKIQYTADEDAESWELVNGKYVKYYSSVLDKDTGIGIPVCDFTKYDEEGEPIDTGFFIDVVDVVDICKVQCKGLSDINGLSGMGYEVECSYNGRDFIYDASNDIVRYRDVELPYFLMVKGDYLGLGAKVSGSPMIGVKNALTGEVIQYIQDEGRIRITEDMDLEFEKVRMQKLTKKGNIEISVESGVKGIYVEWEEDIDVHKAYCCSIPAGALMYIRKGGIDSTESFILNVYKTSSPSEKVIDNEILTWRHARASFTMPDFPVSIEIEEGDSVAADADISMAVLKMNTANLAYTGQPVIPEYEVQLDGTVLKEGVDYTAEVSDNLDAGTAKIYIQGIGEYSGSQERKFTIAKREMNDPLVNIAMGDKVIQNGTASRMPKPEISIDGYRLAEDRDFTIAYSNNEGLTEQAEITITGIGNMSGEWKKNFAIVNEQAELKDAKIIISPERFEYCGEELQPDVNVYYNGVLLNPGMDYDTDYQDNINAGNAVVRIKGLGNYTGEVRKEFVIAKKNLAGEGFLAVAANQKYIPGTQQYKTTAIIKDGTRTLKEGVDYSLTYEPYSEAKAGQEPAVVTVTGLHNYEGERKMTFEICKDGEDLSRAKVQIGRKSYVYDGTEKTPEVEVILAGKILNADEDYIVSYSDNVDAGKARLTVLGAGSYAGSKEAVFKITPKSLLQSKGYSISTIGDQIYCGENRPRPVVTDRKRNEKLTGKDIAYSYKNNKQIGTASVIIKGKGNYKGKLTRTFKVEKMKFDDYDYSVADCAYTGGKVKPDIIATNRSTGDRIVLKAGSAVKAVYTNNIEIGEQAQVQILPKSRKNFDITGTEEPKTISFSIVKCNLEDVTVTALKPQKYKNGQEMMPKLTVMIGKTKLKPNVHYKVTYFNNTERGIGEAVISPVDETHFTGTKKIYFTIQ